MVSTKNRSTERGELRGCLSVATPALERHVLMNAAKQNVGVCSDGSESSGNPDDTSSLLQQQIQFKPAGSSLSNDGVFRFKALAMKTSSTTEPPEKRRKVPIAS